MVLPKSGAPPPNDEGKLPSKYERKLNNVNWSLRCERLNARESIGNGSPPYTERWRPSRLTVQR
jgi:hypothetical protein